MTFKDEYDHADTPSRDHSHRSGVMAAYLPFDAAVYRHGRVPCQLLAAIYLHLSVPYYIQAYNGMPMSLSKKQIREHMEDGMFVWIEPSPPLFFQTNREAAIQIRIEPDRFSPHYTAMQTREDVVAVLGPVAKSFRIKGRKRLYFPDGSVGPGMNIRTVKGGE